MGRKSTSGTRAGYRCLSPRRVTTNALQGSLFNILDGQPLAKRHPKDLSGFPTSEVIVTDISDITLDNARDNLRFYDPGLFPGVFGEQPKNVFNMEVGQ